MMKHPPLARLLALGLALGLVGCVVHVDGGRRRRPTTGHASPAPAPSVDPRHGEREAERAAAAAVLDDFHLAASEADGERYFAHFAAGGVFLGTDASERWTVDEFRSYADPYFSEGRGWTYHPRDRHVFLSAGGGSAWFDERLDNEKYGEVRGTGVLVKLGERWRIAQYNLAFPVPNDLVGQLLEMVRAR